MFACHAYMIIVAHDSFKDDHSCVLTSYIVSLAYAKEFIKQVNTLWYRYCSFSLSFSHSVSNHIKVNHKSGAL